MIVIQMVQMDLNVNCSVDNVTVSETLLVELVHNVELASLVSQTVKVSSALWHIKLKIKFAVFVHELMCQCPLFNFNSTLQLVCVQVDCAIQILDSAYAHQE